MFDWIVTPQESGLKLLSFLIQRLEKKYSARAIKKMIEGNACQINQRTERFASTLLGKGDHITLDINHIAPSENLIVHSSRILFEDESLLVYDKPSGINCDEKGILQLWKSIFPNLQLVHRLDRDTTGVLILAKQSSVFDCLVEQFKEFKIRKSYLAIVDGVIHEAKGNIENYLGRKKTFSGQTIWGKVPQIKGLYASTKWECLNKGEKATLVGCYPKTGRTHQLRVHLAEMGYPILGDFQYAHHFTCSYRPSRILLHAEKIRFKHPLTGLDVNVIAPLPEDFNLALRRLFKPHLAL